MTIATGASSLRRLTALLGLFIALTAALAWPQSVAYGAPGVPDATKSSVGVSTTSVVMGDIVRITLTLRDSANAPVTGFDASLIPVTVRIAPDPTENPVPFGPWTEQASGVYILDQVVGGEGTFHLSFNVEDPPTVLTLIGTFTVVSTLPSAHPAAVVATSSAFTAATSLVITETAAADIAVGSHTSTLPAPAGWEFEAGTLGISASGPDLTAGAASTTASLLTWDVSTGSTAAIDTFVISGIRLRATVATPATVESVWNAPTLAYVDGRVGIRAAFAPPQEPPPSEDPGPPELPATPVVVPPAPVPTAGAPTVPQSPSSAPTVPDTATDGVITSGSIPPEEGFGLITFGGGTVEQLVRATGSPRESMALWTTVNGVFVSYVPGSLVAAVNEAFLAAFPGGVIPPNTPFIGKAE